jgi:ribosome maturation factor RimP
MDTKKVKDLLEEALGENPALFLISLDFSSDNKIQVVVDGDTGVSLKECIRISRNIEHNLYEEEDEEKEDFALEVTSPDIAEPLKVKRQYLKNRNRILTVKTNDRTLEGTLTEVTEDAIVLFWEVREPKPIGKGKVTVEKTATIAYEEITEAKVKIIF